MGMIVVRVVRMVVMRHVAEALLSEEGQVQQAEAVERSDEGTQQHRPVTVGRDPVAGLGGVVPGCLDDRVLGIKPTEERSEEHTSELQSLMRISYAVFCLKKKKI